MQKRDIPFTMVANEVLVRTDISLKAKGLFAYLFSKPENWDFAGDRIIEEMKDGRKVIFAALKELQDAKLLTRQRRSDGKMAYFITYSSLMPETGTSPLALFGQLPKRSMTERGRINNIDIYIPELFKEAQAKSPGYKQKVNDLAARDYLSPREIHEIVIDEFVPYWREKSATGKERWQKEKVFDADRRLGVWLRNYHEHRKDTRCRKNVWHRSGERCYCFNVVVSAPDTRPALPIPMDLREDLNTLAEGMKMS